MSYPIAYIVQSLDNTCGTWIHDFEFKVELEPEITFLWFFKSQPLPTKEAIVAARKKAFFMAHYDRCRKRRIMEVRQYVAEQIESVVWDKDGWSMGEI